MATTRCCLPKHRRPRPARIPRWF